MSEHKTGKSSWTDKEKAAYWSRRKKGLRGQTAYANVHVDVKDEKGKEHHLPVGFKRGPGRSARSLMPTRQVRRAQLRQLARSNGRGQ